MSDRLESTAAVAAARRAWIVLPLAALAYFAIALPHWHPQPNVRSATALVAATLILWISEAAPLGVIALLIPVSANSAGILPWKDAVAAWGDPIVFLFLGAFLLARALDKHGAFDRVGNSALAQRWARGSGVGLAFVVLLIAGTISSVQNNTAVTAMLLPVVLPLAGRTRNPAIVVLALSYGATFGGMATPVGTAPNFQGFAAMKLVDPQSSFLAWMAVGIPVWLGTALIGWVVLWGAAQVRERRGAWKLSRADELARPFVDADVGPARREPELWPATALTARFSPACRIAIIAFAATATTWLATGTVQAVLPAGDGFRAAVERYVPDALPPIVAAGALFVIRARTAASPEAARPILDRHDFQALDWDTLFLIAGGFCLGRVLDASGAARELASCVAAQQLSALALYLTLGAVTVLLSELTSNTATAALMIPIATALAPAVGEPPAKLIFLVALSASLGFALPISTPPNAIVYGTRLIPLRLMATAGLVVDVLSLLWLVTCVRWLA